MEQDCSNDRLNLIYFNGNVIICLLYSSQMNYQYRSNMMCPYYGPQAGDLALPKLAKSTTVRESNDTHAAERAASSLQKQHKFHGFVILLFHINHALRSIVSGAAPVAVMPEYRLASPCVSLRHRPQTLAFRKNWPESQSCQQSSNWSSACTVRFYILSHDSSLLSIFSIASFDRVGSAGDRGMAASTRGP